MHAPAVGKPVVEAPRLKSRSHRLKDFDFGNRWFDEVENRLDYEALKAHPDWSEGWISFDCALYNPGDDRVYLGITSFAGDIFRAFDRASGQFVDLGYSRVADPYDAKFHRALEFGPDGCIYAAIALLHDVDRQYEAPGGAIVRYDPASGDISKLGIPLPHVYIQAMALDNARGKAYCLCFPPERLAVFDLQTRQTTDLGLIGTYGPMTQGQNIALDDDGCVWCNWALTRAWQYDPGPDAARICKYDSSKGRLVYFQHGLPREDGTEGYAKAEAYFNLGDGYMYAGGGNGSFYRIEPSSGRVRHLFTPTPDRPSRLTSVAKAGDGVAYAVTGGEGRCELMRVYYREGRFQLLGPILDQDGRSMYQCHDIVVTPDGTIYACENDNPYRSSYLWEIRVSDSEGKA